MTRHSPCLLAILALLIAGCDKLPGTTPTDGTPPATVRLRTVQHDKHWWIMHPECFVHHPDCPCQKHRRPLLQDAETPAVD